MRLEGKVAVITGSGSGIGRAAACLFAEEGVKVVVAELDSASGQETTRLIRQAGNQATLIQVDVSKLLVHAFSSHNTSTEFDHGCPIV